MSERLTLRPAPFARTDATTAGIMRHVIYATLPLVVAATWFFGPSALLVILASIIGAVALEWAINGRKAIADGSGILTGLLLGLTLPPGLPLWMAFLGGAAGIGLGKLVFGGLGQNPFNPALVGRAFLQAAFPTVLTTWSAPTESADSWFRFGEATFAIPLMHVDAVTSATPLGLQKFEGELTELTGLFWGNTGGSLGETCAILIILGGLYLVWKRAFDWRIPVSILGSVTVFSGIMYLAVDGHPPPQFMLMSGGLLLGTIYMATDPVTSPTTPKGTWIFGIGIGALVVLIRLYGGLPEGVMYAILLMNGATPLIERMTQPRPFGRDKAPR
jgi:Na+-translocating ferredoxin:NAD+ oxidoreductase subunit D